MTDDRWVTTQITGRTKRLPESLVALLLYLPPQGAAWERDEMTAWQLLLRVTARRFYPTIEEIEARRAAEVDAAQVELREPAGGWS